MSLTLHTDVLKTERLADGSLAIIKGTPNPHITSFESACNPLLWRDHHKPFAYAIQHPHSSDILLCRDHLGVEPLYYLHQPEKKVIVASTLPDLFALLPETPRLNNAEIITLFQETKSYTDATYHENIYRVEPGHFMHIRANGKISKHVYWQLTPDTNTLYYRDENDYLAHFTQLLEESIRNATEDHTAIAAEFTAGLDSTSVYCAARACGLTPTPYLYDAMPGSLAAQHYNKIYEEMLLSHFQLSTLQRIKPDHFDPLAIFDHYAKWFAGPAPYLYFMFSNNLHQAVANNGHPLLLSGFGGDQCISGQIPYNFFIPALIRHKNYRAAWKALSSPNTSHFSTLLHFLEHAHPAFFSLFLKVHKLKSIVHPYREKYYPTLNTAEASLVTGIDSHEVRMRIEYSSIVSKKMGFEYRYPLLYPKLLEFFLQLPLTQKRKNGKNRLLIRRYLAGQLKNNLFDQYTKKEGMGIVPGTFEIYQQQYVKGVYTEAFKALPFNHLIKHPDPMIQLRRSIKGYMLKGALTAI